MNHDSAANPPSSMVTGEMTRLLQIAIAPSTRKSTLRGGISFANLRAGGKMCFLPYFLMTFGSFVALLSLRGLAPSTIST